MLVFPDPQYGTLVHEYVYCTVVLEPDPQKYEGLALRLTVLRVWEQD